jgi:hypothetical protein
VISEVVQEAIFVYELLELSYLAMGSSNLGKSGSVGMGIL